MPIRCGAVRVGGREVTAGRKAVSCVDREGRFQQGGTAPVIARQWRRLVILRTSTYRWRVGLKWVVAWVKGRGSSPADLTGAAASMHNCNCGMLLITLFPCKHVNHSSGTYEIWLASDLIRSDQIRGQPYFVCTRGVIDVLAREQCN